MNDQPDYLKGAPSKDDFVRYIAAKTPLAIRCEVCQTSKWTVLHDPETELAGYTIKRPSESAQIVPVCALICNNCGNIKNFLQQWVTEWLAKNPAAK